MKVVSLETAKPHGAIWGLRCAEGGRLGSTEASQELGRGAGRTEGGAGGNGRENVSFKGRAGRKRRQVGDEGGVGASG